MPFEQPSYAQAALQSMLAKKHGVSDIVFHRRDGDRWATIHESFNALVQRCGLLSDPPFNITLHTLRHTFGSWLAIEGIPLRAIQKLMGHKFITTTERYAHLSGENLSTAVQRIERLLPKSLPSSVEEPGNGPGQTPVNLRKDWCGGPESNRHGPCGPRDLKSHPPRLCTVGREHAWKRMACVGPAWIQ